MRNPFDVPAQYILDPSLPLPPGLTKKAKKYITDLREAYQWSMSRRFDGVSLNDASKVAELLIPIMAPLHAEHLAVIPVNPKLKPLASPALVTRGDVDGVDAGPRTVIRACMNLNATGFFLAHNHPGGASEASAQDRAVTRRMVEAARTVDLTFFDHIIIYPPNGFTSIRTEHPDLFR